MKNKRLKEDIDGILEDIYHELHNSSKSELVQWIMELHFYNMSNEDLIEDYKNFYGEIVNVNEKNISN